MNEVTDSLTALSYMITSSAVMRCGVYKKEVINNEKKFAEDDYL